MGLLLSPLTVPQFFNVQINDAIDAVVSFLILLPTGTGWLVQTFHSRFCRK